mmetsp:Transcript_28717/g.84695  ORF Transcript_28717/g.84695 Transcript_28717/m.84695 type:complete len:96 (+) Transcript_28717:301-588(+)
MTWFPTVCFELGSSTLTIRSCHVPTSILFPAANYAQGGEETDVRSLASPAQIKLHSMIMNRPLGGKQRHILKHVPRKHIQTILDILPALAGGRLD